MISPYGEDLLIYGFGSYFNGRADFQDIDLLIVHESTDQKSCSLAIKCKELLMTQISNAHISILSKNEAKQLSFIEKSKAVIIGTVSSNTMHAGAKSIKETTTAQHPQPIRNYEN